MENYNEENIERIRPVLGRVRQTRLVNHISIEGIFKRFGERWELTTLNSFEDYIFQYLERPSSWNRLSVNKGYNERGRRNLVKRMNDYLSVLKMSTEEQRKIFDELSWLHEDIRYSPNTIDVGELNGNK